jgi:hypothetical protein
LAIGYWLLAIGYLVLSIVYWLFVRAAVLAVGLPEPVLALARAALLALVLFAPVLALLPNRRVRCRPPGCAHYCKNPELYSVPLPLPLPSL